MGSNPTYAVYFVDTFYPACICWADYLLSEDFDEQVSWNRASCARNPFGYP